MIEFEGVVLAQYSSSEHSAMVIMLTETGKKSFFARGILKTNSPHSAACSIGSISLMQCSTGKQGALNLTHAKLINTPLNRFNNENDLFAYQWFIEFLNRIDMDIEETWYAWFKHFTNQFNLRSGLWVVGDALFEALEKLGIGINFSSCASCGRMEGIQDFSINDGGLLCSACIDYEKRKTDLVWIKTMIDHFHYHRSTINDQAMKFWIEQALKHVHHELNLELKTGQMLLKIHS
jgi:DNA repair protein RecO